MENSPCFSAVLYFRFCISSFSKNDRPTIFLWDCCKIIVPRKIVAAEIFAGSSGVADAELFQSPGRGSGAAAIPGLRKFPAAFWKPHPLTSFVHPAGGLEPRQFQACGNSRRLIGNYAREQALYTRPGAWIRGNSRLAEIPGGFSETTPADKPCTPGRGPGAAAIPGLRKFPAPYWKPRPRTSFYPPQNDVLPKTNHILPAAKQCLASKFLNVL